ncbi:hypothetical protein [Burkholderia contaminans]|uniref:hypothetical protein n=1 Tax=Burkholderia contaminans TaxID=488447 RepID=UPI000AE2091A|nr:hypothetical protein [Burkholderia contaminans]
MAMLSWIEAVCRRMSGETNAGRIALPGDDDIVHTCRFAAIQAWMNVGASLLQILDRNGDCLALIRHLRARSDRAKDPVPVQFEGQPNLLFARIPGAEARADRLAQ